MKSNSELWLRTPAYRASSTKNNTFVEKWQDKGKQFQASKDGKLWEGKYLGGN